MLDAVMQGMNLLSKCKPGEDLEWFVLDFTESFWQVPLDPAERKYFCAKLTVDGIE